MINLADLGSWKINGVSTPSIDFNVYSLFPLQVGETPPNSYK
jgi:hypothetical protein